jgi:hypothetical protein
VSLTARFALLQFFSHIQLYGHLLVLNSVPSVCVTLPGELGTSISSLKRTNVYTVWFMTESTCVVLCLN